MFTPFSFYRSDEWTKLRKQLMMERVNENGELICARCGRPILKAYDCIGHHKVELTDENVNDFTVSLNPNNIELIHHKCHNIEHRRFEGFRQEVFLVYGSPCAGKTTWVRSVANADDLILDVDAIWESICLSDRNHKPSRLKANVFGIRDLLIDQIRTRTGMWRAAYVISGYPLRSDRDRMCDLLRAVPVFIDTPKDECLSRADDQWREYVEDWFESYVE